MTRARTIPWMVSIAIFIAAHFVYRVEYHPGTRLYNVGIESLQLGNSLALHGTFADPFDPLPTGPSAHVAPGYPALVAVIIRSFGNGAAGNLVLGRVTVLVIALQLSLLPFLARHLGMRFLTGVLAAAAWLLGPIRMYRWESDFVALLAVLLAFPMFTAFRRKLSQVELAVTGLLWGVLLLFSPTPLIVLGAWLLCLYFVARRKRGQLIPLAILPILVILPWVVRNYLVFSEPVFLRDNLGLELAVSNNSCAQYSLDLNRSGINCFSRNHPNESFEEAQKVLQLGEVQYNRVRMKEARAWIRENPGRFLEMTGERFAAFWFPAWTATAAGSPPAGRSSVIVSILTLLSLGGAFLAWQNSCTSVLVLGPWLVVYPLLYYVIQYDERYRHPVLWASFLLGCYLLVEMFSRIREKRGSARIAAEMTSDSSPGVVSD